MIFHSSFTHTAPFNKNLFLYASFLQFFQLYVTVMQRICRCIFVDSQSTKRFSGDLFIYLFLRKQSKTNKVVLRNFRFGRQAQFSELTFGKLGIVSFVDDLATEHISEFWWMRGLITTAWRRGERTHNQMIGSRGCHDLISYRELRQSNQIPATNERLGPLY